MFVLKPFLRGVSTQKYFPTVRYLSTISYPKSKINSTLYISSRDETFSVTQPKFNNEYLKSVADNLENITQDMLKRNILQEGLNIEEFRGQISEFIKESNNLKKAKRKRDKLSTLKKKRPNDNTIVEEYEEFKTFLHQIRYRFYELEDIVVPFLLKIPCSVDNSRCGKIVQEFQGSLDKETASKLGPVNYLRLGYFNHALQPSIVGPGANYLTEDGAQTFHALGDYFFELLLEHGFEAFSGLDNIKSAIVEAVNEKPHDCDPFILNDSEFVDYQQLHLTGESSLAALIGMFIAGNKIEKCKNVQIGSHYGDKTEQTYCVSASVVDTKEQIMAEHDKLYDIFWNAFQNLGFRCRSHYVTEQELPLNQSSKLVISVWQYSTREWIPIVQLSNHSDYIFRRSGITNESGLQLAYASVELLPLIRCWLEHFQDPKTGVVRRPEALKNFYLS